MSRERVADSAAGAVDAANREVVRRLTDPSIVWEGVRRAGDVIEGLDDERLILHAGPPVGWGEMCAAQRHALMGATVFEGWARDLETAATLLESGAVNFEPCHGRGAVGAMSGAMSPSMAVLVVRNSDYQNAAYCKLVERRLQFGEWDDEVAANLHVLANVVGPAIDRAVDHLGGIDTKQIIARAVHMGDECHNRNVAATLLLHSALACALTQVASTEAALACHEYFTRVDQAFLGLAMATAKALTDAASDVPGSSVVTALARNGVRVGIKVAGLGDQWFQGDAQPIEGVYYPGFGPENATRDIGDSAVVETIGLGAMAMAAAPTAGAISGRTYGEVVEWTRDMQAITAGRHPAFTIPALDFLGTPVGIDVRQVVRTGILPTILTGIAANGPPWGRIGAGISRPPEEPFLDALHALGHRLP